MPVAKERASDKDFTILGLAPGASRLEVKTAYRHLVRQWHPDHFYQRPVHEQRHAEERLKEITGAYGRISQEWSRQPKEKPKRPAEEASSPGASESCGQPPPRNASTSRRSAFRWSSLQEKKGDLSTAFRQRAVYFFLAFLCLAALVIINFSPFRKTPEPVSPRVDLGGELNRQLTPGSSPHPASGSNLAQPPPPIPKAPPGKLAHRPAELSMSSPQSFFGLGSSQADVLRIQGVPDKINGQTWTYNLSRVHFKNHKVDRYNNFDGSLKVRLLPLGTIAKGPGYFALGSTQNEVLAVQGTPTRIFKQTWYYGFSTIHFREGRVVAFDNFFGNLKIRMLPTFAEKSLIAGRYFTIGSSEDAVLAAQGTPTRIQGNIWFYHFSNILFRGGKVKYVFDASGNLHFLPPPG